MSNKAKTIFVALTVSIFVMLALTGLLTHHLLKIADAEHGIIGAGEALLRPEAMPIHSAVPEQVDIIRLPEESPSDALSVTETPDLPPKRFVMPASEKKSLHSFPGAKTRDKSTPMTNAVVDSINGTATLLKSDRTPLLLAKGSVLNVGDTISTSQESSLRIIFPDNTLLEIGTTTTVLLDNYCFTKTEPHRCVFALQILSGSCKLSSGLLPSLNPDTFTVRTKMATIEIHGCQLAFRSSAEQDNIYVLELSGEEKITVSHADKGTVKTDISGASLIQEHNLKTITIDNPGTAVTITRDKGAETKTMSAGDMRDAFTTGSSVPDQGVRHDPRFQPLTTVFKIIGGKNYSPQNKKEPGK